MRARVAWLVFLGGALGSILRAILSSYSANTVAILFINIAGAALLGVIQSHPRFRGDERQAFWATGLCGGFTTLSAIDALIANTPSAFTIGFAVLNLVLGVCGYLAANALVRRAHRAVE